MKTFRIIKKNRKYFAATLNGYKCKILIDSNSENLELGEHTLEVEDISVRSKYGTDLIYKLAASVEEQADAGICTLRADYNKNLVEKCRALGGKWDATEKAWIFSGLVEEEVEKLDEKYNSPKVAIEVSATHSFGELTAPLTIAGFVIGKATGRDSGATIADGISFLNGGVTSGGSVKNWRTTIREGSVFRMHMPEACIEDIETEFFDYKKI